MGYAYGQLYGQEISNNMNNLLMYGKSKVAEFLEKLGVPAVTVDMIWT